MANLFLIDELCSTSIAVTPFKIENVSDQIHRWIKQCTLEHVAYKPSVAGASPDKWPSRLIAVGGHDNANVKLCETSLLSISRLYYATLSHCWRSFVPLRLLKTNIAVLSQGIEWDTLPQTFQDAVKMTRNLGLRYLWIDYLCILQDSSQDWTVESNRMYDIYRHSHISLAAVASKNANGGLAYSSSPLSRIPCHVKSAWVSLKNGHKQSIRLRQGATKKISLY